MRSLIWSNTFIRALKKFLRKHPDWRKDIEIGSHDEVY